MARVQILIRKFLWKNNLFFPVTMWFLSRVIIWTTMLLVTPRLSASSNWHWGIFDAWDGIHYRAIATTGYEFIDDGKQHNLAFFPLFPFSIRVLMQFGLSFEVAGLVINNFAFLAALYCLYLWLKECYGTKIAQWGTAVLCWYPAAMFTSVIYTEGLYLFLSIATLRAFDQKQYRWMAIWGAMATATRPTGLALIPALLMAAIKERRSAIAYLASLASATGVLLFSLYCAIRFHNPLAFIAAQRGWRPSLGFDWQGWLNMLMQIVLGEKNWKFGWVEASSGLINDPWHPLIFILICVSGYGLYHFRKSLIAAKIGYGFYGVFLLLLIWVNLSFINQLLNTFMILGGICFLWCCRQKLTSVTIFYGFCGVGLLLASGGTISLSRLAYGIVPLSVGMGMLLSRHPRLGSFTLGLFVVLLAKLAVGFAQEQWVG